MSERYTIDDFLEDLEPAREKLMLGEGLEEDIALESGWNLFKELAREQYTLSGKKASKPEQYFDILSKRVHKERKTYLKARKAYRNSSVSLLASISGSVALGGYAQVRGPGLTPLEAAAALGILGATAYLAVKYFYRGKKGKIQRSASPRFLEAQEVFGGDKVAYVFEAVRNAYKGAQ